jgi:anti-sigma B factor antagonist
VNPGAAIDDFTVRTTSGSQTVIAPRGELDLATVPVFETAVDEIDFSSVRRVVLDLAALAFIDVSGMRAVLRLHELCLADSVALTIRPGPRAVQRVFELTYTRGFLPFTSHSSMSVTVSPSQTEREVRNDR